MELASSVYSVHQIWIRSRQYSVLWCCIGEGRRQRWSWQYPLNCSVLHDDVIKWTHFPRYWPFVRGIHRSPVNSPHKGQWRGALMFTLICVWINGWVNNREAGDLRRNRAHYDVTVMSCHFRACTGVFTFYYLQGHTWWCYDGCSSDLSPLAAFIQVSGLSIRNVFVHVLHGIGLYNSSSKHIWLLLLTTWVCKQLIPYVPTAVEKT